MNQQTLDKIQHYIDEYCMAKKELEESNTFDLVWMYKRKMKAAEKEIMQILIEENQLPTNPLIHQK